MRICGRFGRVVLQTGRGGERERESMTKMETSDLEFATRNPTVFG